MMSIRERIEGLKRYEPEEPNGKWLTAHMEADASGRYLDRSDVLEAVAEAWQSEAPIGWCWLSLEPSHRKHGDVRLIRIWSDGVVCSMAGHEIGTLRDDAFKGGQVPAGAKASRPVRGEGGVMMHLTEYLSSEQAREDVRTLIEQDKQRPFGKIEHDGILLEIAQSGAWTEVMCYGERSMLQVFYRRGDDQFTICDMGMTAQQIRMVTGDLYPEFCDIPDECQPVAWGEDGILECNELTLLGEPFPSSLVKSLPDAICRVLLASYMIRREGTR